MKENNKIMNARKHSEETISKIKGLSELKFSSREIAKIVFGSETKKSSVQDILNRQEISTPTTTQDDKAKKIMFIPDCQVRDGVDMTYLDAIGQYLIDKKPDVVVNIGDFFDMPSLSSYDKGKTSFEGRRLQKDIEAGKEGMRRLLAPLRQYQKNFRNGSNPSYTPRMVFCLGNHEERLKRVSSNNSEFEGFIGYHLLELENDWQVYDFLKPVNIQGINFVHYLSNPMTGKPYGGNAASQLKNVGASFCVGHKQTLEVAIQPVLDGTMRLGIIAGACLTPEHRVLCADLVYRELGNLRQGDKIVSFDENSFTNGRRSRGYCTGEVEAVSRGNKEVFKVTLESGKIFKVTADHKWLSKVGSKYEWRTTDSLRKGTRIPKIMEEWETLDSYDAGWLSGIYDGEGHYTIRNDRTTASMNLGVTQKPGAVSDKIRKTLEDLFGLETTKSHQDHSNCDVFRIKGGVRYVAKVLGSLRPVRLLGKFKPEHLGTVSTSNDKHLDTVVSIESIGLQEIVYIQVDKKTMVVEGYGHHNCYPFDEEYKGQQTGNNHFRGIVMLHEAKNGFADPSFVSTKFLIERLHANPNH